MTEFTMDRLRENLESLNIVDVLDHIFSEEAKSKRKRAYEKQIQMSGFPIKKTLAPTWPGRKSCVKADKQQSRKREQIDVLLVQGNGWLNRAYPPVFRDGRRYARAA